MLPAQFELEVLTYFASRGYMISWTGGPGDGGKDGIVRDWGGHLYIVQCKLYRGRVGAAAVRELIGTVVLNQAYGGFLITTGRFTRGAVETAVGTTVQLVERFRVGDTPEDRTRTGSTGYGGCAPNDMNRPLPPPYWRDMWG